MIGVGSGRGTHACTAIWAVTRVFATGAYISCAVHLHAISVEPTVSAERSSKLYLAPRELSVYIERRGDT